MNGGVCRNATQDPEDYVCECVARYRGQNCSETDECEPDPCVHGNCTVSSYCCGIKCASQITTGMLSR